MGIGRATARHEVASLEESHEGCFLRIGRACHRRARMTFRRLGAFDDDGGDSAESAGASSSEYANGFDPSIERHEVEIPLREILRAIAGARACAEYANGFDPTIERHEVKIPLAEILLAIAEARAREGMSGHA